MRRGPAARSGSARSSLRAPRVEVGSRCELLEKLAFGRREPGRDQDPGLSEQVTGLTARIGQAPAAQPEPLAARCAVRDLDLGLAARRVHGHGSAERRLPGREPQLHMQVVTLDAVDRVREYAHDEVQVASPRTRTAPAALAGQPDPLAVGYP